MSLEFKPKIKSINIASEELTKITLEVKNNSLDGKLDNLRKLSGKTVVVSILPDSYSYTQRIDRSTNTPVEEWLIHQDGTAEIKKTEQTQLDVDGKGNIDIEEVQHKVDKELIDEFIMTATSLELPPNVNINPRDVVTRLQFCEDLGEIASENGLSDAALVNELEKARQWFAPFADFWDKNRDEINFSAKTAAQEETEEDVEDADDQNESADIDNENAESENDSAEIESDETENDTETDPDDETEDDDPEEDENGSEADPY